jgi:hypothetical protein
MVFVINACLAHLLWHPTDAPRPDFLPALTWVAVFASLDFDIDPA